MKWALLAGACGLVCAAPLIVGILSVGFVGISFNLLGVGFGVLALVGASIVAYAYYRKRYVS